MGQVRRFLSLIPERVRVAVVTRNESSFKPETWQKICEIAQVLEDSGTEIWFCPKGYQRYAVTDKRILWFGGIHFLGFEKAANGTMRLCSPELARKLMDKIHREQRTQMALPDIKKATGIFFQKREMQPPSSR